MFREESDMGEKWNVLYSKNIEKVRNQNTHNGVFDLDIFRKELLWDVRRNLHQLIKEEVNEIEMQNFFYKIIKIIWPNYTHVRKGVFFASLMGGVIFKNEIDFVCVDINGNLDLIEIKNPKKVMLIKKTPYRNKVYGLSYNVADPASQLNHAINRFIKLTNVQKNDIEKSLKMPLNSINFDSPRGILVLGRNMEMNEDQKRSLQLNIRENTKITHFFTYDNILAIIDNAIQTIEKNKKMKIDGEFV